MNATTRTWFPMATAKIDDQRIEVRYGNRRLHVPTEQVAWAAIARGGVLGQHLTLYSSTAIPVGSIRLRTGAARKFEGWLNARLRERRAAEQIA